MSASPPLNRRGLRAELLNFDEIDIDYEVERDLRKGEIPKIPREKIYDKIGFFNSSIKIIEESTSLPVEQETFRIFDRKFIHKHSKNYNFVHLGLIQVMMGPLHRLGLDNSIQLCVEDPHRSDSKLATVETSLCQGPVYFQCFPNHIVPLRNSLLLTVRKHGYNCKPGSHVVGLQIKVCCKLMRSDEDEAKALNESPRGESMHFQIINSATGRKIVPWTTQWDQIVLDLSR